MHDEQMIKIGELNEREGQFFSMTTKTTMTISWQYRKAQEQD